MKQRHIKSASINAAMVLRHANIAPGQKFETLKQAQVAQLETEANRCKFQVNPKAKSKRIAIFLQYLNRLCKLA